MSFKFAIIPAIAVIVWFICLNIKTFCPIKKMDNYIPCIAGALGIILAVVIYLTVPGFMPASDWPTVVCIGIASGLAATGGNEIYKQLTKRDDSITMLK